MFIIKWFFSFLKFGDEDLILKTINDSVTDGYYYFPLIKYLSDQTFNISFQHGLDNLNYIPIPIGGIIFHSALLKIFQNFFISVFLIEFIALFLFIIIFFLIFKTFLKTNTSLILSILIITFPLIINLFSLNVIPYVGIFENNLFNSRVPRPLIINLYYFYLIYLLIKFDIDILFYNKIAFIFSIVASLLLTAFYYYFFIILVLFSILLFKHRRKLLSKLNNIKFLYFFSGLIILIPFFLILKFHEVEFMGRMGTISLNLDNKKKLISFYLVKFIEIKFLLILLTNIAIYSFLRAKKITNKFIEIFYYLIFSSMIAPLLFIMISPKINIFYHFNNMIVMQNILFFLFALIILLKKYLNKFSNNNVLIFFVSVILLLNVYEYKKKIDFKKEDRRDLISLIQAIKNNDNFTKDSNIITLEPKIMVWLILNNFEKIRILNGNFTSKKDKMIEKDLFLTLKILNYDEIAFNKYIENKNIGWRYLNKNIQKFFFQKYIANSFITFKNSSDFTSKEINKIKSSSPFMLQQSIIPIFELERLRNEFKDYSLPENKLDFPSFLILNLNEFENIYKDENIEYCEIYSNKTYKVFQRNLSLDNC